MCDHDLIVKLYFTFQDPSCLYFVLQLAEAGDILTWLRKTGSFDMEALIFYSAEILIALEYLHSKGIVHR
jgi:3-phosphoinositide dependent protein kinase-1